MRFFFLNVLHVSTLIIVILAYVISQIRRDFSNLKILTGVNGTNDQFFIFAKIRNDEIWLERI